MFKTSCFHSQAVGLRQATHGSIFGQEAILQVDHRLSDFLVFGQHVVVVQHHPKVLLQREGTGELEHPGRKRGNKLEVGKAVTAPIEALVWGNADYLIQYSAFFS